MWKTIELPINKLIHLYTIDHLPSTEIAKHFGVTSPTILQRLRENNVPINPKHGNPFNKKRIKIKELPTLIKEPQVINERLTGVVTCPDCGKIRRLSLNRQRILDIIKSNGRCIRCATKLRQIPLDIELIRYLYIDQRLTTKQIAGRLGVTNRLIRSNVTRYKIPTRRKGELKFRVIKNKGTLESPVLGDICRGYDIGLNDKAYYIRVACPQCHKERWQHNSHTSRQDSPLCRECSMKLAGVNHSGENAHTWQGGISFEPYTPEFNRHLREQIRERDNYICQLCGMPQNGKLLAVHHIDYNKKNNQPNNLISLCPGSCHNKTTHHREYWTQYFNNLLKERGVLVPIS